MRRSSLFLLSIIASACMGSLEAATPVDLSHHSFVTIKSMLNPTSREASTLKAFRQSVDINQTTHVRMQQYYAGYPVWGSDIVVHHLKNDNDNTTYMNGSIYEQLDRDIGQTPPAVDNNKALAQALQIYENKTGIKQNITHKKSALWIYVDDHNKAHWAYVVSFTVEHQKGLPEKPTFILDAYSYAIYAEWNDLQTLETVSGGGFGGNEKEGQYIYDGLGNDFGKLTISRNSKTENCTLKNSNVTIYNYPDNDSVANFACASTDDNKIYWDGQLGAINGAYSPINDALFVGGVIQGMYQKWYKIPALKDANGKELMLTMHVNKSNLENAYWSNDTQEMTFGDGVPAGEGAAQFYPFVSLGVGAHEVSHGFTYQHANLTYFLQSGGLNESFSDMAAQAAEFYVTGKNTWQIGREIIRPSADDPNGEIALRYMDEPTKDCYGREPGDQCSISNVKDYKILMNVHYSSGVFNKLFYLISTSPKWSTKKAFDVMVAANQYYWTANTSFQQAACGVLHATDDYNYNPTAVQNAITSVGLSTRC